MTQAQQTLLQILQNSLFQTNHGIPADTDWNAVLREAEEQAVLGLAIDAAPEDVRRAWKEHLNTVTAGVIRSLHYQSALCAILQKNGVPAVILKGSAAAIYYPNPARRTTGDIDFLVPKAHFDRARALLLQSGYTVREDPTYPRHIDVIRDNVLFEMHRFFCEGETVTESYIQKGAEHAETARLLGTSFPMLPKLENGLVLLTHMGQHLRVGLGLRQIIDWMLYADRELDDAFWESAFGAAARACGLETIAVVATRLCQRYLGLSERLTWCRDADPQLCEELMESVFLSGNFGFKRPDGRRVEATVANLRQKGVFRYLQQAGEDNWKAYRKHRWLKPFCWIYQIFRYIGQGIRMKRNGAQLGKDYERGAQRVKLLKELEIDP